MQPDHGQLAWAQLNHRARQEALKEKTNPTSKHRWFNRKKKNQEEPKGKDKLSKIKTEEEIKWDLLTAVTQV